MNTPQRLPLHCHHPLHHAGTGCHWRPEHAIGSERSKFNSIRGQRSPSKLSINKLYIYILYSTIESNISKLSYCCNIVFPPHGATPQGYDVSWPDTANPAVQPHHIIEQQASGVQGRLVRGEGRLIGIQPRPLQILHPHRVACDLGWAAHLVYHHHHHGKHSNHPAREVVGALENGA